MNFLKENEYLLLMSHNYTRTSDDNRPYCGAPHSEYVLSLADRIRLYEVGIRTSHEQPAWQTIEPSKGEYNFDYLDGIIRINRAAGLKSLIEIAGWRIPYWIPNEWRARRQDGVYETEVLSMWNEEAQAYSDRYYQLLNAKYENDLDVQFFFGEFQGGEGAYPPSWCIFDDAAIQDYKSLYGTDAMPIPGSPDTLVWFGKKIVEHYVRKGVILYPKFHEIWNEQQFLMDQWNKAFGNFVQPEILKEYRRIFPDACIVLLQYTYYDSSHLQDNIEYVDMLREISGCEVIVEAMYCKGLETTSPKAIAHGFRGQIVRPAFEDQTYQLEDWMVDAIKRSHQLWTDMRTKDENCCFLSDV